MRAFLSHSSKDKAFVRQVAETLGPLLVEYDERTFAYTFNVQAIREALHRCDVFVYFLSSSSCTSTFVEEEQKAALEARGKGLLKKIIIFTLDETSYRALPKWMQEINIVQKVSSPRACAQRVQSAMLEVATTEDIGLGLYLGRDTEESDLRKALTAPRSKVPTALHAVGHFGIGRRTYIKNSLRKFFPRYYDFFAEITIGANQGVEEFYRYLYSLHKVAPISKAASDFSAFQQLTLPLQVAEIAAIIREMNEQGELVLVVDDSGVYTDEGDYQPFLSSLIKELSTEGRPSIAFIQNRMMPFSLRSNHPNSFHQFLKPLSDSDVSELLSLTLNELKIDFHPDQIRQLVEHLDGHPYNVQFAVQFILTYGIQSLIDDPRDLIEWKNRRAEDFLSRIQFTDIENEALSILSEYRYLASGTMVEVLGADTETVAQTLRKLQETCCIERRGNYFHITPPIRDGLRRDKRFNRSDAWKQSVATKICDVIATYTDEDQVPLAILDSAVEAAARSGTPHAFLSNFILPSHLLRIARDYYDDNKRGLCMEFCARAFAMKDRLTVDGQVELLRLWGLSAARSSERAPFDKALAELKKIDTRIAQRVRLFLEGFDLRQRRHLDEAEEKFKAAWKLGKSNQSINRELAKLYCRQKRYVDAELHARAAYDIAPTNPYIIDILAETLLGKWQSGLPIDLRELDRIMEQLSIYGDAPGSSFFLVRKAHQSLRAGQNGEALRAINTAIERTPALLGAYFLRADIYLAMPDVVGAEADVKQIEKLLTAAGGFSEGEEAQLQELEARLLIEKRQYQAAKDHIQTAAFLPHRVQTRLYDQLVRAVGFDPEAAPKNLQEWAKSYRGRPNQNTVRASIRAPNQRPKRR